MQNLPIRWINAPLNYGQRARCFRLRRILVSGPITGQPADASDLKRVCETVTEVPVFANTGVNIDNVCDVFSVASGCIIGTYFKVDGNTWNAVDADRVNRFMDVVNSIR